ncbi:hypothetical protein [Fodinibius sp. Rm-B-1B1-1]|uniref:hypothetical protein n=1 Tax=Fodinibius alkaliphilus TaxID=3140241 RepID=UPI00315A2B70
MDFFKSFNITIKNIVYTFIVILVIGNIITSGIQLSPQEFNVGKLEANLSEEIDANIRMWLTYGVTGIYFVGISLFIYFGNKHRP